MGYFEARHGLLDALALEREVLGVSEEDIVRQYERFAYAIAREYYTPTGDRADLNQEALVGLLTAIRTFNPALSSFPTFAGLCIRRKLVNTIKMQNRGKHGPLSQSVRVVGDADGTEHSALERIEAPDADPVDVLTAREEMRRLLASIRDDLTPLERHCLLGLLAGDSYSDIAPARAKAVDNALRRARKKLRAAA